MPAQEYSPRRSRTSRKPWPECPDIAIYRCPKCGRIFQGLEFEVPKGSTAGPTSGAFTGAGPEAPLGMPPAMPSTVPSCCGSPMKRLEPFKLGDVPGLEARYRIVGGLNNSAVEVFWEGAGPERRPEWIMLKTFTGSYIRYLTGKKRPPMVFPLADEDAYVYCDRPVCDQCVFRCKRGFIIYVYFKVHGLLEMPMDEMSDYFATRAF